MAPQLPLQSTISVSIGRPPWHPGPGLRLVGRPPRAVNLPVNLKPNRHGDRDLTVTVTMTRDSLSLPVRPGLTGTAAGKRAWPRRRRSGPGVTVTTPGTNCDRLSRAAASGRGLFQVNLKPGPGHGEPLNSEQCRRRSGAGRRRDSGSADSARSGLSGPGRHGHSGRPYRRDSAGGELAESPARTRSAVLTESACQ